MEKQFEVWLHQEILKADEISKGPEMWDRKNAGDRCEILKHALQALAEFRSLSPAP